MQLPDSGCEVITTLQYYESRLLTNQWSFPPEHDVMKLMKFMYLVHYIYYMCYAKGIE